jgi:Phage integrase family
MLKRRLKQSGLPAHYSPHSFRATGITNFLENDGTLEAAQRIAGHADSRTTKLYDRRGQKVLHLERNPELGISLHIFEKHLLPSAIVEFRRSAVGMTANPLGHIQSPPFSR